MATINANGYSIEIIPLHHYYRWDGSDTNEFTYDISIYREGKRQVYHIGKNGDALDVFSVETMDHMISQVCFQAIDTQQEQYATDMFSGGFDLFFTPNKGNWRVLLYLNPYFLNHDAGIQLELCIDESKLFEFGRMIRMEEARVIGKI